jgi:dethiobiotin synthetase
LAIVGTSIGCGKTVLATGLARTLLDEGLQVKAIKPICTGDATSASGELAFISSISHTPLDYRVQYISQPGGLKPSQVQEAIRIATQGTELTLVELPGSPAFPLTYFDAQNTALPRTYTDTCDLAYELAWPCLVVGKFGVGSFEDLVVNATYLQSRGLEVIALALVKTAAEITGDKAKQLSEQAQIALQERTGVPYIGTLEYSQSISVERVNQGNLIKTTSQALDLLPIIKSLNVRVAS